MRSLTNRVCVALDALASRGLIADDDNPHQIVGALSLYEPEFFLISAVSLIPHIRLWMQRHKMGVRTVNPEEVECNTKL